MAESTPVTSLRGMHLLLVGGDMRHTRFLKRALEASDALVIACASAAKALRVMEHVRVDILLVDVQDPDDDSRQLIGDVRALSREQGGDTPAVAVTRSLEDREALLAAGFQANLTRPVDVANLCQTLAALVHR